MSPVNKIIKVGVIGVGVMGQNHVRVYSQMKNVKLVSVADMDGKLLQSVSSQYNVKGYSDYKKMMENEDLDAVSLAVPTKYHYACAIEIIQKNIHVLIEKPFATNVSECKEIIKIAQKKKIILGVGHIERFNPVITSLKKRLDQNELGRIFQISIRRVGPYPTRIQDVGVFLDLTTHDIDIMHYLLDAKILRFTSEKDRLINSTNEDLTVTLLRFSNGVIGLLIENWLSPTKIRDISISGEKGMFVANFLTQDLYFYENNYKTSTWETMQVFRGVGEGNMIRFAIDKKEPLRVELEAFIESILTNKPFLVRGIDGLRAVEIALKLESAALSY